MSEQQYTENLKVIVAEKLQTLPNFNEDVKYVAEYIVLLMVNGGSLESVVKELSTLFDSVSVESLTDVVQTAFFALEAMQQGETVETIVNHIRMTAAAASAPTEAAPSVAAPVAQQQEQPVVSAFSNIVPNTEPAPQPEDTNKFTSTGYQPKFQRGVGKRRGGAGRGGSHNNGRNNNNNNSSNGGARFNPLAKALGMAGDNVTNVVHHKKEGRCKLFPRCPLGRSCPHAHPTKVCSEYPNCPKPPGTCEYLHPNEDEELMREIEKTREEFQKRKAAILAARAKPVQTGIVICKFGTLCSNPMCPFGHPTPANEDAKVIDLMWCSQNLKCEDPQCTKAHSSLSKIKEVKPLNARHAAAAAATTSVKPPLPPVEKSLEQCKFGTHCTNKRCKYRHARSPVLCRDGANCTRIDCLFSHPINEDCRFGIDCKNQRCLFRHPNGRLLDNTAVDTSTSGSMSQRPFAIADNGETIQAAPSQATATEQDTDMN